MTLGAVICGTARLTTGDIVGPLVGTGDRDGAAVGSKEGRMRPDPNSTEIFV